MAEHPGTEVEKIEAGFRWLLTRNPDETERDAMVQFFKKHPDWTAIARALLCLDESITVN